MLVGCVNRPMNLDNDALMQAYLNNKLSYPTSGEEYCLNIYRVDSLNGFPILYTQKDISGATESMRDFYDYDSYNSTMDSLYTIEKDRIYKYPDYFYVDRKIDWQYIFRNKENIIFEQHDDKLLLINTKEKQKYHTHNVLYLEKAFMYNVKRVKFDIDLISKLNDLMSVKIYTKDTLKVELSFEDEFSEENIRNNISNILKREEASTAKRTKHSYLLHYNRDGEMVVFNRQDTVVPASIKQNEELLQYLSAILERYPQAHFIHFNAIAWDNTSVKH